MATVTKDDELSSFDVPEATRHSSGHTQYKIVLQVTPKELTKNSYQLVYWKRYNDIRKLYEVLHRYHQAIFRPGKFPDFPEKTRFMERFDAAVVEERRVATKSFLNYALQHKYLCTHEAYTNFFQKGEKVLLPDVQTATLKPEIIAPQTSISATVTPTSVTPEPVIETKKKEELLVTTDDEPTKNVSNRCAHILEDLTDLKFEQNEVVKPDELLLTTDEKEHIENVSNQSAQILEDLTDLQLAQKEEVKTDDFLLTTDEKERIENVSNRCAQILEDLTDLQFDQQEEMKKEKEEFNLIKEEVDQAANLMSLPLATTTKSNDSF